jgi:hypothetical protein
VKGTGELYVHVACLIHSKSGQVKFGGGGWGVVNNHTLPALQDRIFQKLMSRPAGVTIYVKTEMVTKFKTGLQLTKAGLTELVRCIEDQLQIKQFEVIKS